MISWPSVEAVSANDPASRDSTRYQNSSIPNVTINGKVSQTVHLGENAPQRFGRIDTSSGDAATKAFCKVAQKIKGLRGVVTPVNSLEVNCFLTMQGCGVGKNPI